VSLGADCWYKGIVLHELLHAVGFWHEMNRPDRDSYIHVYWANILQVGKPQTSYRRSFARSQI